ncbi:MAG: phosphoribosylglycinamide formyltransferase [Alphaproteobacteria bacterium]|nr:phosphoribosylglycinamide formyltransferase [Alphaproteobacteria bacterium]
MSLNLAVFISGRGSNMLSILKACEDPDFPARMSLVVSNRPDAAGLNTAQSNGISTETIDHKAYDTREAFEEEISARLKNYDIDLIVLAGFMRIFTDSFVEKWPRRIINIHPSLLPDYKGTHTHKRAIEDGKSEGGCTVHYVIPELDSGPIIAQKRVPILPGDTPDTLADRVLVQEHILYPEAIRLVAESLA